MMIPCGFYRLRLTLSPRFGEVLPLLDGVYGYAADHRTNRRTGIRIHPGNTVADSSGCILVGQRNQSRLLNSRRALAALMVHLQEAFSSKEEIAIEIIDASPRKLAQDRGYDYATMHRFAEPDDSLSENSIY